VAFLREEFSRSHPMLHVLMGERCLVAGERAMQGIEVATAAAFVGAAPPPLVLRETRFPAAA
jgi:hypothetical protein